MTRLSTTPGPIGVFDSGYGGLTILDEIRRKLPQYDYIYLGDNAVHRTAHARLTSCIASLSKLCAIFSSKDASS